MKTVVLDGAMMTDRAGMYDYLTERLGLPGYFGRNLDALHDCLTSISEPTRLVIYRPAPMLEALGQYAETAMQLLRSTAAENPCLEVVFDAE